MGADADLLTVNGGGESSLRIHSRAPTPAYPPCGSAFLRHLHTDPRSKHVNLPKTASEDGKPTALRQAFRRVSTTNVTDPVAPPITGQSKATSTTPPIAGPTPGRSDSPMPLPIKPQPPHYSIEIGTASADNDTKPSAILDYSTTSSSNISSPNIMMMTTATPSAPSSPTSSSCQSPTHPNPTRSSRRRPQTAPSRPSTSHELRAPPSSSDSPSLEDMGYLVVEGENGAGDQSCDPPILSSSPVADIPHLAATPATQEASASGSASGSATAASATREGFPSYRRNSLEQLPWQEFGRAYAHGSWDPVRIPRAPFADPVSERNNNPSSFNRPHTSSSRQPPHLPPRLFPSPQYHSAPTGGARHSRSVDTVMTDPMANSDPSVITTSPTNAAAQQQRSFDRNGVAEPSTGGSKPGRLQMPDSSISAATVRLASSSIPPSMFTPLGIPNAERDLVAHLPPIQQATPSIRASSDPGMSSSRQQLTAFTRSASSHSTATEQSLPTIQDSPLGTPGDLSGLPPTVPRVRGPVHGRIPPASAPLYKGEPIAVTQEGDYFGDAVVANAEGRAPASAPVEYPPVQHYSQAELFYRQHGFLAAPPPVNEAKRLKALYNFNILHTSSDANFDRIVHMIKLVFKVKIGFITMVDSEQAWFKAKAGFEAPFAPRPTSFCGHTILNDNDEPMVVLDALQDWRFCNNPNVVGPPHVRFYAGAPLRTSTGYNVGSLCIVDDTPRPEFPPRSRHILKEFAAIVMREMELWRDRVSDTKTWDRLTYSCNCARVARSRRRWRSSHASVSRSTRSSARAISSPQAA